MFLQTPKTVVLSSAFSTLMCSVERNRPVLLVLHLALCFSVACPVMLLYLAGKIVCVCVCVCERDRDRDRDRQRETETHREKKRETQDAKVYLIGQWPSQRFY